MAKNDRINSQNKKKFVAQLRDRDGNACGICGVNLARKVTVDHRVPASKGGSNNLDNLQLSHLICNREKGNK